MKQKRIRWINFLMAIGCVGLTGITACRATLAGDPNKPIKIEAHITLDIREVKQTANSIEDMVSGKAAAPSPKQSFLRAPWFEGVAWAAEPQIKTMTPEIQKALEGRKGRYDSLKAYKAQGLVGEDNQGHAAALGSAIEAISLVEAENRDREVIYRAIVEQNAQPPEAIATVRAAFAEVQREKADSGEKIQLPSGQWQTK